MNDRHNLYALIKQFGLETLVAQLTWLVLPSIRIKTHSVDESTLPLGTSKFGGVPDLPPQFSYPLFDQNPLSFVAQINLRALKQYPIASVLPADGILYFFYREDFENYPQQPDEWRVLYYEGELSQLRRRHPQGKLFKACTLDFTEDLTLRWFSYRREKTVSRILGYPDAIQEAVFLECEELSTPGDFTYTETERPTLLQKALSEWVLLLQIDSEPDVGMMWGDMGKLYFCIRRKDLQAQRFEKVYCDFQCS